MRTDSLQALIKREAQATRLYIDNLYRQLEAFASLTNLLPLRYPLPPMRGWAVSPDFALSLLQILCEEKPKVIVEFGPGVSTLVTAYWLQQYLEHGTIYSFEHESEWLRRNEEAVRRHGLARNACLF